MDATLVTRVLENGGHILGKAACEVSPQVMDPLYQDVTSH